ncbi:putative ribonuclease H-like domain-containing protein [Tanacetum coccineum]
MVPREVLMKSGLVSLNTARQVNTAHPKLIMNSARPMSNVSKTAHLTVKRPIHKNTTFKNSNFNQRVNIVKDKNVNTVRLKVVVNAAKPKAVVNTVKGNNVNAVKALACWGNPQMDLQDQGVIDNGCLRHMTGNMSYLTNYEEIDYVAFAGNSKGGKITGTKACDDACKARMETVPGKDYILLPLWPAYHHSLKKNKLKVLIQEKDDNVNSTNNVNAASTNKVNVVGGKKSIELPDDPNIAALEDIMDVKSAFLYGKIKEEVYVCQPPGFEDPDFPDRVYKLEKALYGLHQAPRAWYETLSTYLLENGFQRGKIDKTLFIRRDKVKQKKIGIFINQDKYVTEILKKFGFTDVKTVSTPMETQKPLLKDEDGEEVDVYLYRSMIGSLMYLTSSRPDIMYLKGQPKLGLWYPKDSPFNLVAYTHSDYAGTSLDRKSTIGGCQFLGCRLISW